MTKRVHAIRFPNHFTDILRAKRTVAHMPIIAEHSFAVGDELQLLGGPNFWCGSVTLVAADRMHLLAIVDDDLAVLNVTSREEYLARWDALHPSLPSRGNPKVWRIAWRYETPSIPDPPEWSLAA
jgi:hypothetical protein